MNHIQNIESDHVLIFLPSRGPNGSMLKVARKALAKSQ